MGALRSGTAVSAVPEEAALRCTRIAHLPASVLPPREGDAARREQEVSNDESVQPPNMDPVHDAIERLEWDDAKGEETPHSRLKALTRRTALTGGAAGLATAILTACGGGGEAQRRDDLDGQGAASGGTPASGIFDSSKKFKFVFVNHVTTNPFFVPTRYGAEDACKLLGCSYQWTGSENSNVNEMVNAFNTAITGGADGIAVALVDAKAFNGPTDAALKAKIPVVSYNADSTQNARLSYIGQDLFVSGQEMGKHIAELVPSGDVALFIATPARPTSSRASTAPRTR